MRSVSTPHARAQPCAATQLKCSIELHVSINNLMCCSFWLRRRHRHLMLDLAQRLPHVKKDFKLDTKSDRGVIYEVRPMPRPGPTSVVYMRTFRSTEHSSQ